MRRHRLATRNTITPGVPQAFRAMPAGDENQPEGSVPTLVDSRSPTSGNQGIVMSVSTSQTTALIAGAVWAAAAMFSAPTAGADQSVACEPGQIVIDGQCQLGTAASKAPGSATDSGGKDSGSSGSGGQHG